MEKRIILFVVVASVVFVGSMLVQSLSRPRQQANDPAANDVQQVEQADDPLERQPETNEQSPADQPPRPPAETPQPPPAAVDQDDELSQPAEYPMQLVALGSMDPQSPHRLLATFDSRGATVRRIELNARQSGGQLRYRDLEVNYGYLGELDPVNQTPAGVRVRVVGPGTPAAGAGLQVDDVITGINGEPVGDVVDFAHMIEQTRPRQQIVLNVRRPGATDGLELTATLTDKPMEVVKPDPGGQLVGDPLRRTMQFTLRQQGEPGFGWPEIDSAMRSGNWKTVADQAQGMVEFSFEVPDKLLRRHGMAGPIEVIKRFRMPADDGTEPHELGRKFHIDMEIEIRNKSDQVQNVNYELIGPTGTPIEGWWYHIKIHGRWSAIGYAAGPRDIVSGTQANSFSFLGGPEIISKIQHAERDKFVFVIPPEQNDPEQYLVNFLGVDTHYFVAALLPKADSPSKFTCYDVLAITASDVPEQKARRKLTDLTFSVFSNRLELAPHTGVEDPSTVVQTFEIFAGPKEPALLRQYGLQDCVTFGWFAVFSKPLVWLLHAFHFVLPYSLCIILLTVVVRVCMIPISRKAVMNAQMMQYLQPEIKRIAEKYKDDMEKRAQAQRELFARYKYNPFGGCLLVLLQLPIFIGLYRGLSVDIALRGQPLFYGLQWCANLAGPDKLFYWKNWGLPFLFDETGWLGPYFNLLPIVTVVLFLAQQKLLTPPPTDDQQRMMQKMMTFMMLFMGVLFFKVASGLCIYFITSSIWGILERKLIPKPKLPENLAPLGEGDKSTRSTRKRAEPAAPLDNQKQLEERRRRDRERKKRLKERN